MKLPRFFSRLVRAARQWHEDDGSLMAAAVAYYASLSFFPLLLIVISVLGGIMRFTNWGQDAREQVLSAIADYTSPTVQQAVASLLDQVQDQVAVGGPIGLATLLITAGALFFHFERAFERIWNVPRESRGLLNAFRRLLWYRIRAFLMLLGLSFLLLINLVASIVWSSMRSFAEVFLTSGQWFWSPLQILASLAINTALITILYWQFPRSEVRVQEALRGALVAATAWEIGRFALVAFLLTDKYSAYGIVGSFIAIMAWIFYGASVVFLGAEYVQVICDECQQDRN